MTADPVVHGVTDEPLERLPAHECGGFPPSSVHIDQDEHEALSRHAGGIGWTGQRLRGGVDSVSSVSTVTLTTSLSEDGDEDDSERGTAIGRCWSRVQAWLVEHSFAPLALVDGHYSGSKSAQAVIGGGSFNYFPEDEFAAFVVAEPWKAPENVVLVIQPEEGETRVFRPR